MHEYLVIQLGERPECRLRALSLLDVLCFNRRLPDALQHGLPQFLSNGSIREAQRQPNTSLHELLHFRTHGLTREAQHQPNALLHGLHLKASLAP
jgi:hypothetical protein